MNSADSKRNTTIWRGRVAVWPLPQLMSILPSSVLISASMWPFFSPSPLAWLVSRPIRPPSMLTSSFEPPKKLKMGAA